MSSIIEALKKVRAIYDRPEIADRYTVIMKNGDVFGMSENVKSPTGINTYLGDISELPDARSGKKVNKQNLPYEVKWGIATRADEPGRLGDIMIDREKINIYDTTPTMGLVDKALGVKPELGERYASQLPYFNTVSIRNELSVTAWNLILEGLNTGI